MFVLGYFVKTVIDELLKYLINTLLNSEKATLNATEKKEGSVLIRQMRQPVYPQSNDARVSLSLKERYVNVFYHSRRKLHYSHNRQRKEYNAF